MVSKLTVSMGEKSYPVYFSEDYSHLVKCMEIAKIKGKVLIITDSNLEKILLESLKTELGKSGLELFSFVFEAGEKSKNTDVLQNIYEILIEKKFDRQGTIIALGGGVVGDIAGMAAATYYRGIQFIQIPTTLLATVDSSIGGKVGIDYKGLKNIIGTFYQPKFVYINVQSLKTLSRREFMSGFVELLKHSLIRNPELLDYIEFNREKILRYDENALIYIIKESCAIKSEIVAKDEKEESGLRALLNFGHTIGHALESAANFSILHGECVSVGIYGAYKYAAYLGILEEGVLAKIDSLYRLFELKKSYSGISPEKVFDNIFYDKKVSHGKIFFILPKNIGEVFYLPVENIDLLQQVIKELREED